MADKKISALIGATTPLAGTEVLPIVQGSATVKVSVADLTAGRVVAMAGGSFTDNITQSTAAKGVNFTANTPAAGMTSRLLNWYEEGTWTPTDASGAGLVIAITAGTTPTYTRIGRLVTCNADVTYPITANATTARLSMPFTPSATIPQGAGMTSFKSNGTNQFSSVGATGAVFLQVTNAFLTNASLSGVRFSTTWTYHV